jgi:GDPmannose 4,6-dehydratase
MFIRRLWQNYKQMKTALIIGVSGQDGAYLSRLLIDKGYRVVGTSRDAQVSTFLNLVTLGIRNQVITESLAVNDFRSVINVLKKVQPDDIYNLGGQSSVGLSFDQPLETFESIGIGTLNLLEGVRFLELSSRIYNAGSSECFGNTSGKAADESTPFRPRSPYAMAKSAAHWAVTNYREAYGLFACSGILFNHESPFRAERFVTQKIIKAACRIAMGSDEKLHLGNIHIQRDWGWAPEYVEAMFLMLQQKEPDDFVIATGKTCKLGDFVRLAFERLDLDWQDYVQCSTELLRPTDIMISRANPSKAKVMLGWIAKYRTEDVVNMMVDFEMENNY